MIQQSKIKSKKLPILTFCATLLVTSFTYAAENKSAVEALTEAYKNDLSNSYNSEDVVSIWLEKDDSPFISKEHNLANELVEKELEIYHKLSSPGGVNFINIANNSQIVIDSSLDLDKKYADAVFSVKYNIDGFKASVEIPFHFGFKDEFSLYLDPQIVQAFGVALPPELNNKLIQLTLNDIPDLSPDMKAKLRPDGPLVTKLVNELNNMSTTFEHDTIRDVPLTEPAKAAGAVRYIELIPNLKSGSQKSAENSAKLFAILGSELGLSPEELKEFNDDANNEVDPTFYFIESVNSLNGLNDKNQIVYSELIISFKGAKHKGRIKIVTKNTNFGAPVAKFDITQKPFLTGLQLMNVIKNLYLYN